MTPKQYCGTNVHSVRALYCESPPRLAVPGLCRAVRVHAALRRRLLLCRC